MVAATFQGNVSRDPAPAIAGDFASANDYTSVSAGPGAFVAGVGVTVGQFAWGLKPGGIANGYYVAGGMIGFVHREPQASITAFLGTNSNLRLAGYPVTLHGRGEFWANFPAGAVFGQKVFADSGTGACSAGAAGSGVAGTMTAAVSNTGLMTVSAITGTPLVVGQSVAIAGLPSGSYISALGTGTGGTGTYQLANAAGTAYTTVGSGTVSYAGAIETPFFVATGVPVNAVFTGSIAANGVLTISAIASGVPAQGLSLAGTGILGGNYQIVSQLTGTPGGTGTYQTNQYSSAVVASTTITGSQNTLAKISTWQV